MSGSGHVAGYEKGPLRSSQGPFDFEFSQLVAVVAVGPGNQKFIYVVRLEPSVSPDADAVTIEQARVRPAAHRMWVGVETLGYLGHG